MKRKARRVKLLTAAIMVMFLLQTASCGTLIYPERRGQTGGRIDVGIAVLDGIGILLFVIPGLIAFTVDFITGAIYLPGGKRRSSTSPDFDERVVIRVDPRELSRERIEDIVSQRTGLPVKLDGDNVQVYPLERTENMAAEISRILNAVDYDRPLPMVAFRNK